MQTSTKQLLNTDTDDGENRLLCEKSTAYFNIQGKFPGKQSKKSLQRRVKSNERKLCALPDEGIKD